MTSASWNIFIDTGGTFTDCIANSPEGELLRLKILSSSILRAKVGEIIDNTSFRVELPSAMTRSNMNGFSCSRGNRVVRIKAIDNSSQLVTTDGSLSVTSGDTVDITTNEEVPVFAARLLTGTPLGHPFPPINLRLGSTRGTNALLERKGAKVALITTKGFKDLLLIGNQQRPELFSLAINKRPPLYHTAAEIAGRMDAEGRELETLNLDEVNALCLRLKKQKVESVAIAFLNSYRNPAHELTVQTHLHSHGFRFVSCSHQLSSQINLVPRTVTTVANAYLDPIINNYIRRIAAGLNTNRFFVMSSAGGLLPAEQFHPKDSLLSGPAGGVLGAYKKAVEAGALRSISFDMGGTSTDVSLCHDRPEYRFDCIVGDQKILSPSIAIETIASGGGSICAFDGYRFTVGPHSAGAYPGPACYGANGPLTLTDVNLLLGRIDEQRFAIPLHTTAAEKAFQDLLNRLPERNENSREKVLEAFVDIANEKMAEAIRRVSLQRGYAANQYTLLTFGGAGGQHACALATMLGLPEIIVPYEAGLLSAFGIGSASIEKILEKQLLADLSKVSETLDNHIDELAEIGFNQWESEGLNRNAASLAHVFLFVRLAGQETPLEVEYKKGDDVMKLFKRKYKSIYGHWLPNRNVEVESIKVLLRIHKEEISSDKQLLKKYRPVPKRNKPVCWSGKWMDASVFYWEELRSGALITGPSLITSSNSTVFVEPGWDLGLDHRGNAKLRNVDSIKKAAVEMEWAQLELYSNRFTSIATDMGALMQRTSFSVNVKERMDFSCAILDEKGRLIVNAPHIPVHLGSLGVCVREIVRTMDLHPGDVVLTNHPAFGGSHLPDLTLIKPVYHRKKLLGYVANRAHHAEIGGIKPGSMPANATRLIDEGVVIYPTLLLNKGKARWTEVEKILTEAPYPTRNIRENVADLNGALAALHEGEKAILHMVTEFGSEEVSVFMHKIYVHASRLMREKIKKMRTTRRRAVEFLDDGTRMEVNITKAGEKLVIDFSGTAESHPGNLNATRAIVQSVVLYVMRLLIDQPVPLNEGLLSHVKVILPKCFLNPAFQKNQRNAPAVAGGNTEVSQRLTDLLVKAFELAACSQGTMNNVLFGNDRMGYYETIGGGVGAGKGFDGADAVHQHMTNTKITDPEMLEHRYPVRLEEFSIRNRSGGKGKWNGGNGITRIIHFLEPLEVNILSQHRVIPPFGKKGGEPGKTGEQFLIQSTGNKIALPGTAGFDVVSGDRLIIHTPGGGGWGKIS